jgi:DNA-directed RNA polymerase subunit L
MNSFNLYNNQQMMAQQVVLQVKVYLHSLGNVLQNYVSEESGAKILADIVSYGDEHGWFDVRKIAKKMLEMHFEESVVNEILKETEKEFKKAWAPMRKGALIGLLFIFGGIFLGGFFILTDTLGGLGVWVILIGMILGMYFIVKGRAEIREKFGDL